MKPVYIVVTPFFPSPTNWRGAYCYDFVAALKKLGKYRVEVFVPGAGDDYEIGGITVHRFPTRQLPSAMLPFLFARRNANSFLSAVERSGIDIQDVAFCHAHTAELVIYALAVKKMNPSCRTLLHHHDLQSFGLNGGMLKHCWLHNMIQFPVLRRYHERVDCHVFISEASRRSFLSAPDTKWTEYLDYKRQMRGLPYRSVRIKNSVILHNGVNLAIFSPSGRVPHEGFIIGCIANFEELKDQMTLLGAVNIITRNRPLRGFATHREANTPSGASAERRRDAEMYREGIKVVFVGTGPELERCRSYAMEHNIDAEFRSEVRHELLPDFYRSIDLFVLPSYFEGFGCVFTEAWSCGTPFITCEGQGMDDLISREEKDKWLCTKRDPSDFAQKIEQYIKRPIQQRLTSEIDITKLVSEFLDKIERI